MQHACGSAWTRDAHPADAYSVKHDLEHFVVGHSLLVIVRQEVDLHRWRRCYTDPSGTLARPKDRVSLSWWVAWSLLRCCGNLHQPLCSSAAAVAHLMNRDLVRKVDVQHLDESGSIDQLHAAGADSGSVCGVMARYVTILDLGSVGLRGCYLSCSENLGTPALLRPARHKLKHVALDNCASGAHEREEKNQVERPQH